MKGLDDEVQLSNRTLTLYHRSRYQSIMYALSYKMLPKGPELKSSKKRLDVKDAISNV